MSLRYSVYFVLTFFIYLMCDDLYFSDFGFFNLCGPKQLKVFRFFEALRSQAAGSLQAVLSFSILRSFGNIFCLTNWTKLFCYYYVCLFHQIALRGQYLRFCCDLVFALLNRVGEAVFCMSLSLVALVVLILSVRDVHCLFYLANWVSLACFQIDINKSGTCGKLTLNMDLWLN